MNEEMMKLYKEHGVNPAGGCLPLLIQIPFFFGIFSMLRVGHRVPPEPLDPLDRRPVRARIPTTSRPS